jgi:hypothetical protein
MIHNNENKSLTKKYNINGPVNIVRLSNGIKTIYIFADIHNDLNNQTQCEYENNIETIDIDKLLIKIFKTNLDKKYDLFIEYGFNDYKYDNNFYKNIYIQEIWKLGFNNTDLVDGKIHISKYIPNIRVHYFDIRRQNIKNFDDFYFKFLPSFVNKYFPYDKYTMSTIIKDLNYFIDIINIFMEHLADEKNKDINKIKKKYSNKKINEIILRLFNKYIHGYINNIIKLCNDTIDYIQNNKINKNSKIEELYDSQKIIYINIIKIDKNFRNLTCIYTDLYLLRRLLDKEYIINSLIYTGAFHFVDIIYFLVKYFDFKVTHISKSDQEIDNGSINKLNEIINNIDYTDYDSVVYLRNYLIFDTFQCSNLFDFPDNLL